MPSQSPPSLPPRGIALDGYADGSRRNSGGGRSAELHSQCVGRDEELHLLREAYDRAASRGEQLALLEGPSGMGKSGILQEFRSRVRLSGGVVLEGRCEPGAAFGPFADIVAGALRFLEEVGRSPTVQLNDLGCSQGCHRFWYLHHGDAEAWIERDRSVASDAEVVERRLRFFDALRGLLKDVAAVRAPVVLFHGLVRADLGSLQLLQFLLDGTGPWSADVAPERQLHALFVADVRTDREHPYADALEALLDHPATSRITVGTLDANGVRAYLQSPETVARVIARTGGMPEAIDLLLEGDPLTPEARVQRQLSGLSAGARGLVEALAVVEHPSDAEHLARIASITVAPAGRNEFGSCELIDRSIVDGAILFTFARGRDREHVYRGLSDDRRRELHSQAAHAFQLRPGSEQDAAHHALCAHDYERAVPLSLSAAETLAARHAHAEAAALLERVVAQAPGELPIALLEYLVDLYRVAGDYKGALAHAGQIRETHPESAGAARREGELLTLAGHLERATEALTDARRLADASEDPIAVAQVDAQLAELHWQRAAYDEAEASARTALEAGTELEDLVIQLQARNTLGKLALSRRDDRTGADMFERNRNAAAAAGLHHREAQALTNLAVALLRRQDLEAAEDASRQAIEVAISASDTRERAIATENLAVLAHLQHDYARARDLYHEAVAMLKRLGNRPMLARVATNLGELYFSLGDTVRARTLCEFASHMGGPGLPATVTSEILVLRGRIEAAEGNTGAARAAFDAVLRTFQRLGEARTAVAMIELARVTLAEGDLVATRTLVCELPTQTSPKRAAQVALLTAELERASGRSAASSARRAVELAERSQDKEIRIRALTKLARAAFDEGELALADETLRKAELLEGQLAEAVPEEALSAFQNRATCLDLRQVQALVAQAGRESTSPGDRRISSVPPPPRRNAPDHQKRARWAKSYPNLVGNSDAMSAVQTLLDKVAPTDALVLIRGESGTGKELIAEALHTNSARKDKPLVKVNCAALVETLLLSELFGHERGAFTGANARKKGRFEMADGGSIFLDEIGDISPKTQVALLRILQERQFERVGGTTPIKVDVRIIAATHRDLEAMVREGTFREDLYYRLRGVMVEMPPLRTHLDDLAELCAHLLDRIGRERGEAAKVMSQEALELLRGHRWPGNVRELENVLRSATLFAESYVLEVGDFAAFAETFSSNRRSDGTQASTAEPVELEDMLYDRIREGERSLLEMKKVLERECITRALADTSGNITKAASLLGMKRPRLSQLVKQYGLNISEPKANDSVGESK